MMFLTTLEKEKRKSYHNILIKFKPKFWVTAMFPHGFENNKYEHWEIKDLSNNDVSVRGSPILKMDDDHKLGIYLNGTTRIVSKHSFTDTFTFFIVCRKRNKDDIGRLITGNWGNIVIGFWNNYIDVVHMNKFIVPGRLVDDTDLYFFMLRVKTNYIDYRNIFHGFVSSKDNITIPHFKNIVIGQPITFTKDHSPGYIYECLCFDYFLNDDDVYIIIDFIKKFYASK